MDHGEVIKNPTQKIKANKPIIVASGWKPSVHRFWTRCCWLKVGVSENRGQFIQHYYVYDRDPRVNPGAEKFEKINWNDFRKNCGARESGSQSPFDPLAAKEAQKLGLFINIDCEGNYNTHYAVQSNNCIDSYFIYDCVNCKNCFYLQI